MVRGAGTNSREPGLASVKHFRSRHFPPDTRCSSPGPQLRQLEIGCHASCHDSHTAIRVAHALDKNPYGFWASLARQRNGLVVSGGPGVMGEVIARHRIGSSHSIDGRARHAMAPRRTRARAHRAKMRRIASVPSRRCPSDRPLRNTGPMRLSVASIQAFAEGVGAEGCDASDSVGALGTRLAVNGEVNAGFLEVDLLDVEADKCTTAGTGGGQQQQCSIAQAGEVAGAGDRHADEAGCRRRAARQAARQRWNRSLSVVWRSATLTGAAGTRPGTPPSH